MTKDNADLRIDGNIRRGAPVTIFIEEQPVRAYLGETVAAALWAAGFRKLRNSLKKNAPQGMYCGMGVCFGCRVTIDGIPNVLACQTAVIEGMRIRVQKGHGRWET